MCPERNIEFCRLDPGDDFEMDEEMRFNLGLMALGAGKLAHEIFDDPDWHETIMFDLNVSTHTWAEIFKILSQTKRGGM